MHVPPPRLPPPYTGVDQFHIADPRQDRRSRWITAVGLLAGALVLLVVIGVLGDGDGDGEDGATAVPAPEVETGDEAESAADPDAHRTGDGCVEIVAPAGWTTIREHPRAGSEFSIDPEAPVDRDPDRGEPGALVRLSCGRVDDLGRAGPVDVPGADLVGEDEVDAADGPWRLLEYRYPDPAGDDDMATVQVTIDRDGFRCSLRASGTADTLARLRPTLDGAVTTLRCVGR